MADDTNTAEVEYCIIHRRPATRRFGMSRLPVCAVCETQMPESELFPLNDTEPCQACRHEFMAGVFWPVVITGDRTLPWVAQCLACNRYGSTLEAVQALISEIRRRYGDGLGTVGFSEGRPQGAEVLPLKPYLIVNGQPFWKSSLTVKQAEDDSSAILRATTNQIENLHAELEAFRTERDAQRQVTAEEVRSLRIRAHDAEGQVAAYIDGNRRRIEDMESAYKLIVRLWRRQLPGFFGESWDEPGDPPHDDPSMRDLEHREVAHLLRAVYEYGPRDYLNVDGA